MASVAGRFIISSPALDDPNFTRTIVLVCEHDEAGAFGVVLNRATSEPVDAHLPAWAPALATPPVVFIGGPVEPEVAVALAEGAQDPCLGDVGLAEITDDGPSGLGRVRVFAGYSGWGPGQLDAELSAGAWEVVAGHPEEVFHPDPEHLWADVLRRQRGDVALWSTLPVDPSLN